MVYKEPAMTPNSVKRAILHQHNLYSAPAMQSVPEWFFKLSIPERLGILVAMEASLTVLLKDCSDPDFQRLEKEFGAFGINQMSALVAAFYPEKFLSAYNKANG